MSKNAEPKTKIPNPRDKNQQNTPKITRRIPRQLARFSTKPSLKTPHPSVSSGPSGLPLCASAPPVKGVLSLTTNTRKRFFVILRSFLKEMQKSNNFNNLTHSDTASWIHDHSSLSATQDGCPEGSARTTLYSVAARKNPTKCRRRKGIKTCVIPESDHCIRGK